MIAQKNYGFVTLGLFSRFKFKFNNNTDCTTDDIFGFLFVLK